MTEELTERLYRKILTLRGRTILGIYLDPVAEQTMILERDAKAARLGERTAGGYTEFMGYPLKGTTRPGAWIICAGEWDEETEFQV